MLVRHAVDVHGMPQRRACGLFRVQRSTWYYRSRKSPETALRLQLRDLAMSRPRYGYRRLHVLLRRRGVVVNHKKVHRLYREEGLWSDGRLGERSRVSSAPSRQHPFVRTNAGAWTSCRTCSPMADASAP